MLMKYLEHYCLAKTFGFLVLVDPFLGSIVNLKHSRKWTRLLISLCRMNIHHIKKFYGNNDGKMPLGFNNYNIRPTTLYRFNCWALKEQDVHKMNIMEIGILGWVSGHTTIDKVKWEYIPTSGSGDGTYRW